MFPDAGNEICLSRLSVRPKTEPEPKEMVQLSRGPSTSPHYYMSHKYRGIRSNYVVAVFESCRKCYFDTAVLDIEFELERDKHRVK